MVLTNKQISETRNRKSAETRTFVTNPIASKPKKPLRSNPGIADSETFDSEKIVSGMLRNAGLLKRVPVNQDVIRTEIEKAFDIVAEASSIAHESLMNSIVPMAEISAAGDRIDRLNAENSALIKQLTGSNP
jgi:hypothetical protein